MPMKMKKKGFKPKSPAAYRTIKPKAPAKVKLRKP